MTTRDKMPVRVYVHDTRDGDKTIRKLDLNYNSKNQRAIFLKTVFWGLNNGHAVEIVQTKDDF